MRIEINAKKLNDFLEELDRFTRAGGISDELIQSMEEVVRQTHELNGGVGELGPAVEQIQAMIATEKKRKADLLNVKAKTEAFAEEVVRVDAAVAERSNNSTEEFLRLHPWLKPPVFPPNFGLSEVSLWEKIKEMIQKCLDDIKEWYKENLPDDIEGMMKELEAGEGAVELAAGAMTSAAMMAMAARDEVEDDGIPWEWQLEPENEKNGQEMEEQLTGDQNTQIMANGNIKVLEGNYDSVTGELKYTERSISLPDGNDAKAVKEYMWFYFKAQGFTDVCVAGILGNAYAESGYIPHQGLKENSRYRGLFQLGSSKAAGQRFQKLEKKAQEMRGSKSRWVDVDVQCAYAMDEYNKRKASNLTIIVNGNHGGNTIGNEEGFFPLTASAAEFESATDERRAALIWAAIYENCISGTRGDDGNYPALQASDKRAEEATNSLDW